MNRTGRPLNIGSVGELAAFARHTRQRLPAYLGDGNGVIDVPANGTNHHHLGRVYIRFASGVDSAGNTKFTQAVAARNETDIEYHINYPILVRYDQTSGDYIVVEADHKRLAQAGANPHSLNKNHPVSKRIHLRQIVEGNVFAVATATTDSTKVTIEPFVYWFDGALYSGGKGITDNVDLAAYIPTAGNERLVVVGLNYADNSVQVISGSTRTISGSKYTLSDLDTLVQQLDDFTRPHRAVRLANNASTVREKALHSDVRQFLNVPQPRGFVQVVNRHIRITDNYQELFTTLTVEGVLQVDGLLVEVGVGSVGGGGGGGSVIAHASTHETGGADEIDGDKLDIDFTPSNYTPATTPAEADNADNLTAHLYGIDAALLSSTTLNALLITFGTDSVIDDVDKFLIFSNGATLQQISATSLASGIGSRLTDTFRQADGVYFVDPTLPTWTALNQGSGTYSEDTTNNRLTAIVDGDGTRRVRGWHTPDPSGGTPYTITAHIKLIVEETNNNGYIVGWRQSSTTEITGFMCFYNGGTSSIRFSSSKFDDENTLNSNYSTQDMDQICNWVKLEDDGANRNIYISDDGIAWTLFHTIGNTNFLTADQIVFGYSGGDATTTFETSTALLSYEEG